MGRRRVHGALATDSASGLVAAMPRARPLQEYIAPELYSAAATRLEQFEHARFEDPPCREAWRIIEATASAGSVPEGPDLIAAIEDEGIGCIVCALFVEGLRAGRLDSSA